MNRLTEQTTAARAEIEKWIARQEAKAERATRLHQIANSQGWKAVRQPLSQKSQAIFDKIVTLAGPAGYVKIDNAPGAFMALSVERIGANWWSLAHYSEQNGDLMSDPMMTFLVVDGLAFAHEIQQDFVGQYRRADDQRPAIQRDLAVFANIWLPNIKSQQGI